MHELTRRDLGRAALAAFAPLRLQVPAARRYAYVHLDVFTERRYEGNQLLTFLQPDGLDVDAMQTLTRESNYSECTFIFPPDRPGTDYRVRIFTRTAETPFAGHPTIGSAFALAHGGVIKPGTTRTVFGLGVGPTPIDLEWDGARLKFAWMTQLNPTFGKTVTDTAGLAAAIGLDAGALVARAPAQEVHTGSTFLIVPIATRKAVDSAVLDRTRIDAVFAAAGIQRRGVYVCSTEPAPDGATAYSRLLSAGGIEDPATGSAAGPAGSFLVKHGLVPAGQGSRITFLQGVLVRRPSRIHVNVAGTSENITSVKVGGPAVVVGEGSVSWGA
jgi:trans-2,3-dihydro-3-hydroxyanthranilate isomerase